MREIEIDISRHTSKTVDDLGDREFDVVVTVCDSARESCPYVPARRSLHPSFPDPSAGTGTDEERLAVCRHVRDQLAEWIGATFGSTDELSTAT